MTRGLTLCHIAYNIYMTRGLTPCHKSLHKNMTRGLTPCHKIRYINQKQGQKSEPYVLHNFAPVITIFTQRR